MFSGIIEETATIVSVSGQANYMRLCLKSGLNLETSKVGDSFAIDGVCLTATVVNGQLLEFDVGSETFRCTTLSKLESGARVNLERALGFGNPIHGHLVTGHVDCTAALISRQAEGETEKLVFELPAVIKPLLAPKGAVAVSGISLTVGEVRENSFSVYIIPHTAQATTLTQIQPGNMVNLEADILARYVESVLKTSPGAADERLAGKLKAAGFIV